MVFREKWLVQLTTQTIIEVLFLKTTLPLWYAVVLHAAHFITRNIKMIDVLGAAQSPRDQGSWALNPGDHNLLHPHPEQGRQEMPGQMVHAV